MNLGLSISCQALHLEGVPILSLHHERVNQTPTTVAAWKNSGGKAATVDDVVQCGCVFAGGANGVVVQWDQDSGVCLTLTLTLIGTMGPRLRCVRHQRLLPNVLCINIVC